MVSFNGTLPRVACDREPPTAAWPESVTCCNWGQTSFPSAYPNAAMVPLRGGWKTAYAAGISA